MRVFCKGEPICRPLNASTPETPPLLPFPATFTHISSLWLFSKILDFAQMFQHLYILGIHEQESIKCVLRQNLVRLFISSLSGPQIVHYHEQKVPIKSLKKGVTNVLLPNDDDLVHSNDGLYCRVQCNRIGPKGDAWKGGGPGQPSWELQMGLRLCKFSNLNLQGKHVNNWDSK